MDTSYVSIVCQKSDVINSASRKMTCRRLRSCTCVVFLAAQR